MRRLAPLLVLGSLVPLALVVSNCEGDPADADITQRTGALITRSAIMRDVNGRQVGTVTFNETAQGRVQVTASFNFAGSTTQVREGFHGFHIHANDNPANGSGCIADPTQPAATHFVSADGHYDLSGSTHNLHTGDMPSPFFLNDLVGVMSFEKRFDPNNIVGRAVILHAGIDNFNNVPVGTAADQYTANSAAATTATAATGNAGTRMACGIIQ